MATKNINKIRAAVCKNRGGHDDDSDGQIMVIWKSLSSEVKTQYLDSVKSEGKTVILKGKSNADIDG